MDYPPPPRQEEGAQVQVGLTYDLDGKLPKCAAEVSQVTDCLRTAGHDVVLIGTACDLVDKLAAGQRFDLVFNTCRPALSPSAAALLPALLEAYSIGCCFSNAATISLCQQRSVLKSLLRDRGVPTSDYWLVETLADISRVDASYPVCVGPAISMASSQPFTATNGGELSKACCQVMSQYEAAALVEPQFSDPCITVAMLGSGASATVLLPKATSVKLASSLQRIAQATWKIVGGLDAGCVTMQCGSEGLPHVVSVQPLPSLEASSEFLQLADDNGLTADKVFDCILKTAAGRMTSNSIQLRPHLNKN
jgi:D-alanine-D-alanine ligase